MKEVKLLPEGYGDGWMSKNAQDLVRIAVYFAGFDAAEVTNRIFATSNPKLTCNTATVQRVLQEIDMEIKEAMV